MLESRIPVLNADSMAIVSRPVEIIHGDYRSHSSHGPAAWLAANNYQCTGVSRCVEAELHIVRIGLNLIRLRHAKLHIGKAIGKGSA